MEKIVSKVLFSARFLVDQKRRYPSLLPNKAKTKQHLKQKATPEAKSSLKFK